MGEGEEEGRAGRVGARGRKKGGRQGWGRGRKKGRGGGQRPDILYTHLRPVDRTNQLKVHNKSNQAPDN